MNNINTTFIRARSYYSFLESLLSPAALAEMASKQGVKSLGLIDHNFLTGAVEFYESCRQFDIQPILGLELDIAYHQFEGRLALIAKDHSGWENLSKLSSLALADEKRINLSHINAHRKGLIALLGGYENFLQKLIYQSPAFEKRDEQFINDINEIFSENCFIEVQRYSGGPLKNEPALISFSKQFNIKLIASQNIAYAYSKDHSIFTTITAIRKNLPRIQINGQEFPQGGFSFPAKHEFSHRYRNLPEALDNLNLITERCSLELPIGKTHYPIFPTPPGISQSDYLRDRAYAGAKKIYGQITDQIKERLDYELKVIIDMGYEPIFLIMEDVLTHTREFGIPTSSRGSAASSLVAHCLNITTPDPIELNLYFERFLNPARNKPPDIDTDIASHRRDEVIQYVFNKYNSDKVAMVGTINRYRPRSSFSDVAKAYGLSPETIRQLTKKLPSGFRSQELSERNDPFGPLLQDKSIPIIKDIISDAKALLDIPKHLSVHPGGIVISPFPIKNMVPLTHSTSLGVNHTQFDLEGIEKFGLVKLDLLGIRGLTVLGKVADQIQIWHQKDYKNGLEVLEKIPAEEAKTAKIISSGQTIGCFQIESPGMRALLKEIQAKSYKDIMVGLSLYRPGPLRGGLRDAFVRRFRGEDPVEHIHDSLVNILDETLGVILYQEQVLMIAHELGGLSIAQADILRRIMSHPDSGEALKTLRSHFIQGAIDRKNISIEMAEHIWEMMAAFAGYGYPKAHAASYAQLAWYSAWCKAHYPAEFMCAVLGHGGGYYSQRVYMMEAYRMGLKIKPPDINVANHRFRVVYPQGEPVLYMGLEQVRDLTQKTIKSIIKNRPFQSIEEFMFKVNPQPKEARHLIICGAMEELTNIPQALQLIDAKRMPGQMNLFNTFSHEEDWSREKKSRAQQEILGVSLDHSLLKQAYEKIQSFDVISTLESENFIGQKVWVAGMRQTFRRFRNQSNQIFGILTIEDLEGSLAILISPQLLRRQSDDIQQEGPFLIYGVIESIRGQVSVFAEKIQLLK